jgi:hypothetical protein
MTQSKELMTDEQKLEQKLEQQARLIAEITRAAMQIRDAEGLRIKTVVVAAIYEDDGGVEHWEVRFSGSAFTAISLMDISRESMIRRLTSNSST